MNLLTKSILSDITAMVRKQGYYPHSVFSGGIYHHVETEAHINNVMQYSESEINVITYKRGVGDGIKITMQTEHGNVTHFDYESNAAINLWSELIDTQAYRAAVDPDRRRHAING